VTRLNDHWFNGCVQLKTWVFCVGFTLSFGAMFSKTWRVHAIFTNVQLNKKVRDSSLLIV